MDHDSPEYLAEQLALAEHRLQEATEPEEIAAWRERLTDLERRALRWVRDQAAVVEPRCEAAGEADEQ